MWIDDIILKRCAESLAVHTWVPTENLVVFGSSNQEERESFAERTKAEAVTRLRRAGGGGTVVLYPGCTIVSVGTWVKQLYQNDVYFRLINQAVIDVIAKHWPALTGLGQSGISDIAFSGRKIAGTSLFRSGNYLLYQASIIAELDIAAISRYLQHPSKEPDYRKGRSHKDFLTSLSDCAATPISPHTVADVMQKDLPSSLLKTLGEELIEPVAKQQPNIAARVARES